jgi:polar amino acid transport system substrate-binding protein
MKSKGLTLVVVVLLFLFSGSCFAQSLEFVTLQYPPYEFEDNGELKGIALEIVENAFERMNKPISIRLLPWAKAVRHIKKGKADAIFTAFKNPDRESFADFSREVLVHQTVSLFVRADSNITFDGDLKKLSSSTFGVVRKVSYGKIFDDALKKKQIKQIVVSETGEENMQKLLEGRFDILVSNRFGALHILNQMDKIDEVRELKPELESVPSYIAFSKKRNLSSLRDQFDAVLKEMKRDGTYNRIIESYIQ